MHSERVHWQVAVAFATAVHTFALALLCFPELRHFTVFTLTHSAVPQHTHAVIWPKGAVTPEVDFEVAEEGSLDKV